MKVSYINLMRAQQRHLPPFARVADEGLSVADILARGKKARAALGILPGQAITSVEEAAQERRDEVAAVVEPSASVPPVVIVVTQEALDQEDDRTPLVPTSSWKKIVREVSQKHGVAIIDIISDRRSRPYVRARHEAMYRMRNETTMSFPQIGRRLGGRDHTTVLHGIRSHEKRLAEASFGE